MRIGHALLAFAMVAWGYTGAEPTIYVSPADVGEGEPVEVEVSLAGKIGERRFRRNLHASTGALVGAVILLMAVTGMPWTIFWGANFHGFVASQQIGRPEELAGPAGEQDHESISR